MPKKSLKAVEKKPAKHRSGTVFQIKITLSDAPVPIWRRLILSADMPLSLVHEVFQIGMGWWNCHLYHFESKGRHFGDIERSDDDQSLEDDMKFTLNDLISVPGDSFEYVYDFGDGWQHQIVLEDVIYPAAKLELVASCIVGRRACPPEDVGGVGGYSEFLDIIEDPQHKERIDRLEWAGGDFDPNSFDLRGVNHRLGMLREMLLEFESQK